MTITPDQARELLDGATSGPWWIHPAYGTVEPDVISGEGCRFVATDEDLNLSAKAPDLAQAIAGMRWDYQVVGDSEWFITPEEAEMHAHALGVPDFRPLCRRLVSAPEPVEVIEGE